MGVFGTAVVRDFSHRFRAVDERESGVFYVECLDGQSRELVVTCAFARPAEKSKTDRETKETWRVTDPPLCASDLSWTSLHFLLLYRVQNSDPNGSFP
jgi:hypothetical protein